jgi:hypothetical protein
MRDSTVVSKTNPTIKKILAATVGPSFKGRKIRVDEVNSGFAYDLYLEMGSPFIAFIASANGSSGREVIRPSMNRPTVRLEYESFRGACLVVYRRGYAESVTIYIPELDASVVSVAVDALLENKKKDAARTLAQLGEYAGIGMAVAEGRSKGLVRDESEDSERDLAARRGKQRKTAAQLDREIDSILGRR